jgi:hypothetical protein
MAPNPKLMSEVEAQAKRLLDLTEDGEDVNWVASNFLPGEEGSGHFRGRVFQTEHNFEGAFGSYGGMYSDAYEDDDALMGLDWLMLLDLNWILEPSHGYTVDNNEILYGNDIFEDEEVEEFFNGNCQERQIVIDLEKLHNKLKEAAEAIGKIVVDGKLLFYDSYYENLMLGEKRDANDRELGFIRDFLKGLADEAQREIDEVKRREEELAAKDPKAREQAMKLMGEMAEEQGWGAVISHLQKR